MTRSRYTDSQIMEILKQADTSTPVPELCREHGMSSATFYKWHSINNRISNIMIESEEYKKILVQQNKFSISEITNNLIIVQNRLYSQLESLTWLQRRLQIKGQLPPLRGWAASPDVLLLLHTHIMETKPKVIVEFGSGSSSLVIADALRQNGAGKLVSIEHSDYYGSQTLQTLRAEGLEKWVDLQVADLEAWEAEHLNPVDAEKPSRWYSLALLEDLENIDLLWVDGPPGGTCLFSRYPALPALVDKLSPQAEVWLDDTVRQEEKDICERWATDYGFDLRYYAFEKGLGRLTRTSDKEEGSRADVVLKEEAPHEVVNSVPASGFDFTLDQNLQKG